MARPLRIEFAGATYHIMARGNQGRAIFDDNRDRLRFLETLGEACDKTGWRIHAYVLMGNHYHLLVETPEANLVTGMKWLQGTYTQRYNGRHQVFGHLFQGRYKAVPVDGASTGYLETVSTYIHLNPARAGLIEIGKEKLKSYRWSSYPWYLSLPGRGPAWLERRRVMEGLRLKPEDRRGYEAYLEGRALEIGLKAGRVELEEQWKALRRGWYVGGEGFAARLRNKSAGGAGAAAARIAQWRGQARTRGRGRRATAAEGLGVAWADEGGFGPLAQARGEKAALGGWLRARTTVSLRWVSARLEMGHYTNASRSPRRLNRGGFRKYQKIRSKLDLVDASD